MALWRFGLRAKAISALLLACLLAMLPAGLIGWQLFERVRNHFGEAYAVNFTLLKRQSILAPISRELALSRRLADSVVAIQWLQDENNPEKRALFFKEAERYRKDFRDHAYSIASVGSRSYYANDNSKPYSEQPRYNLSRDNSGDSWFFSSLARNEDYNINVDYDRVLQVTRVWFNVLVRDGERKLGVAGAGIDLSSFLKDFIASSEPGVASIVINQAGAIQAHGDERLIAYNTAASDAGASQTLAGLLPEGEQRGALAEAMGKAFSQPGKVFTLHVSLDGREQLLALSYIPELKWHVVTAVDLQTAQVLDKTWTNAAVAVFAALLTFLLVAFAWAVERLVLHPLNKLKLSAAAMAQGDFNVSLPPPSQDELGDLSRAFGVMADQVRRNTEELENKVLARTQALEAANMEMRRAQQKIGDSLDYASLIQRATLPDQQLKQSLGRHHFVLWRPRDVVGGDFYVFRAEGERCLIGVVDCAGHGVPGALMTMLARSALDNATNRVGIESPAAILEQTDESIRSMIGQCDFPRAIATNMDTGLVYVDRSRNILRFAGAKIGLYWSDGREVEEIKGVRRAIGDRRRGCYADTEIAVRPDATYYLVTDGFLDQAGGELGYGFGNTRFTQLLLQHARLPMEAQAAALDRALDDYRGECPQRDDITILSFRFD
ncbi:Serine phosphatase RsbU, regulator of sigma subunit [Formivibrio citricus]|uniref:Serine phosphatase RsbU, regulator of sigma subunit n=1 Tax=Formivibrio citricus TaxID=83765 RepID=A0A1I4VV79_9NEIS|nr:biofilm regulation protein phosphatase SiaA [Formivibrio citricus]SFN05228.1 Serine phosphatase RsbU, regulator of sigma subunit [Formivibrio citricus]